MAKTVGQSPSIRIDLAAERLWRDDLVVPLRPKTWDVLRRLLRNPGALVTKDELLDAVWADSAVSEGTLNKSIGELRLALGDDRERPRFIETVPRRGFRWLAQAEAPVAAGGGPGTGAPAAGEARTPEPADAAAPALVGRREELDALEHAFARAAAGTRQVVFVTGEAGAGKSTLVDAFLARRHRDRLPVVTAHGQCIEAFGQHEPYRPLLEVLERLARPTAANDPAGGALAILRTHAPSWLRQIPSLGASAATADEDSGMAPARMLREFAAAMEELSRSRPLVLVLEDMHWADLATTDACNLLARRRDPARLMVIVTMRATDALVARHPVLAAKSDLVRREQAAEISLEPFPPAAVQDYLHERCTGLEFDPELAAWIHHQSAGNPLFVRVLVDDLVQRGVLAAGADGRWASAASVDELRDFVPDSLRELVERQVDRLTEQERNVIDAAAVLRSEFPSDSVAAIAGLAPDLVEETCEDLAGRGQVLKYAGRGRGGAASPTGRFAFVHSMVQRILHDRLPATRLRRLHLAAAAQLEREHPGREDSVAVQLALHYAMAGDAAPAIAQLQRAAASVQRIPAPREVIVIREQILDLVERSPGLPGHRRELVVATMDLAEARQLAFAVVDSETTALCERVLELATSAEDGRECFLATMGLFSNRFYTGRYDEAREIGRRLLMAAEMAGHPFMRKSAHFAIAGASYRLADFDEATRHFEACLGHSADSQQTYGWDFHLMSMSHLALLAVHRGLPDEARRLVREAEAHGSRGGKSPDAAAIPLFGYALALLGDDDDAMVRVQKALAQSERIGAAAWIERARFVAGLVRSRRDGGSEGLRQMKDSLDRQARNHVLIDRSAYSALLAGEMLRLGEGDAAPVLDEAFAYMERSGERHFEAELRRLRDALG